jgi:hypothetical protein
MKRNCPISAFPSLIPRGLPSYDKKSIAMAITSIRMRWVKRVARVGSFKNRHKILVGKLGR